MASHKPMSALSKIWWTTKTAKYSSRSSSPLSFHHHHHHPSSSSSYYRQSTMTRRDEKSIEQETSNTPDPIWEWQSTSGKQRSHTTSTPHCSLDTFSYQTTPYSSEHNRGDWARIRTRQKTEDSPTWHSVMSNRSTTWIWATSAWWLTSFDELQNRWKNWKSSSKERTRFRTRASASFSTHKKLKNRCIIGQPFNEREQTCNNTY